MSSSSEVRTLDITLDVETLLNAGPVAEEAERAAKARQDKSGRGELARVAYETLEILRAGSYKENTTGEEIDIRELIRVACGSTRFLPAAGYVAPTLSASSSSTPPVLISVQTCTTLGAMLELAAKGSERLGVLNFASARNPGGGFSTGARAQEESLARASALYPCLMVHFSEFFVPHRRSKSGPYTHAMMYSPDVPVFRDDSHALIRPIMANFVTAAAPNVGSMGGDDAAYQEAEDLLQERILRVLNLFAEHGNTDLVLGAWGCGVFENDPGTVASLFRRHLTGAFARRFRSVVFAVLDPAMSEIFADVLERGKKPPPRRTGKSTGKAKGKGKSKDKAKGHK